MKLQKNVDYKLQSLGSRTNNERTVVSYLYQRPFINANKIAEITIISLPSAYKLIGELEELDIVKEITGANEENSIGLMITSTCSDKNTWLS